MAKRAGKVTGDKPIDRAVWVPAWAYNLLVERAEQEPWFNPKAELSRILERALIAEFRPEGQEPGKTQPVRQTT